jgi:hypothetical protein
MLFQTLLLGLLEGLVTHHSFLTTLCLTNETTLAKLETMGISIDKWTEEQERYARAYAEGT